MKTRNTVMLLAAVTLLVAIPVFAAVDPPLLLDVSLGVIDIDPDPIEEELIDVLCVDWDDSQVGVAAKYSVDIWGVLTYDTGEDDPETGYDILSDLEVELSFGTSDRIDGGDMADTYLCIPVSDIHAGLLDALADAGIDPAAVVSMALEAKVKSLDPGKGKGSQNNAFSNSLPLPDHP